MRRVLFYGGSLLAVTIMCQGFFEDMFTSLLGDDTGQSLFDFVRTNVEAPITVIFVALYLDMVLRPHGHPGVESTP